MRKEYSTIRIRKENYEKLKELSKDNMISIVNLIDAILKGKIRIKDDEIEIIKKN